MKNTLSLIAFSLIAFFIVSCSGGEGPEVAAKAYLDAINANEFEKAKEFATEDSKEIIDLYSKIEAISVNKKEGAEKEVVNDLKCKIEGDATAVCTYLTATKEEKSINLKKVADKWLVYLPKEEPVVGGEGGQSKICKCMDESAKGSKWYQDHELECMELSASGERCND